MSVTIPVLPESMKRSLVESVRDYRSQLTGSVAEEYLMTTRGLTREVLDSFQIGFVDQPRMGDDIFKGMIAIPFLTRTGPVAIQYRAVGSREPRFLNRGSTKRIYNPSVLLEPHRTVWMCEGCIDTITVAQLGLPVVGLPGVSQWDKVFARAFRNRKVVVLADGDDKGQGREFANRVLMDVEECDIVIFEGADVNSFWMEHGEDGLKEKLGID